MATHWHIGFREAALFLIMGLGVLVGAGAAIYAPRFFSPDLHTSSRFLERLSQFDAISSVAPNVFIGDSLVERGLWNELLPAFQIANRGLGGATISIVADQARKLPLSTKNVFIIAGVNDVSTGRDADAIAGDYRELITSLRSQRQTVIVVSTLPTDRAEWNEQIDRLNLALEEACRTGDCRFINVTAAMTTNGLIRPDLTKDGIHLMGAGYRILADAIRPAIEEINPQ